jgi:hypothetical protein
MVSKRSTATWKSFLSRSPCRRHIVCRSGIVPREIFGGGARVSPVNMPTKLRLTRREGQLIDFDNAGHMFMVTRRFVDLVEGFQKDAQYFPIECF